MPELPDVQVFEDYLDQTALHQRIEHVYVSAKGLLDDVSASTLRSHLTGRALEGSRRHGKHLFVDAGEGGWLRLHFGMTGYLRYYAQDGAPPDHVRLRLDFAGDHHLAYSNTRRMGQIGLVDDVDAYLEAARLGPDALDPELDVARFREALAGRSGALKSTLMNQSVVAGIGNVYADEILFDAGVHPEAKTDALRAETVEALFGAMKRALRRAIEARVEDFPDDFLVPHRRDGAECPRCGGTVKKIEVSGRSAYYCRDHQTARR